jgi:long-chain fatty acid transport protein
MRFASQAQTGQRRLATGARLLPALLAVTLALVMAPAPAAAQGIFLPGTGPINQSLGTAAVAAPLDSAGALNWNPASISGLYRSEVAIALGVVIPDTSLSSEAFGLAGTTQGDSGVMPVPTMSIVVKTPNSPWTWGVGVYGIGGFSANFPASSLSDPSTANPILTPQPPNGVGVGRVYSHSEIYQVAPTVSYALTDKFSVGFAPTIDLAMVQVDPLIFAPPNVSGGVPTYGPGTGSRYTWGGGFQLGMYWITEGNWRFGASYKSKQWFEPFQFNSNDVNGNPVFVSSNVELPQIVSVGASFTGFERLLYAVDVRYFDYENALRFNGTGYRADGAVNGLGWRSVVAVCNGIQYNFTDRLSGRLGYMYIENPVPSSQEQFNVGTALIMQHLLSVGGSYRIRKNILANIAYTHGFGASLSGPYVTPSGPIPGTNITSYTAADWITAGLTVDF